jgi:2-C-methyl-D-erythritol 2,4-cyclodiphosphate synthase
MMRFGLGVCSHRFISSDSTKPCVIAGVTFDDIAGFQHNSDGDVVFYALCHAISSLTQVDVLADVAGKLYLVDGITDSEIYVKEALLLLQKEKIVQLQCSLEAKRPLFKEHYDKIRQNLSRILSLDPKQIGITAISGDGLSDVSCGDGVRCTILLVTESV